ncbi:MAG: hypothetical protein IKE76_06925 [Clostridia bacterium]|nr:hypothetical protein [Clostridia bacterium]
MGEPITLTVTTYDGYEFSSLTVDGVDVTAGVTNGAYTFYMPDNDVTVSATFQFTGSSNAWAALQTLLDNASTEEDNPTVIPLTEDYTATNSDGPLKIPSGKYVTLDLAGHTIDRNLSSRTDIGSVIIVNGTLTVKDSGTGGTITGGNNNGNGGGVYVANSGAFTMSISMKATSAGHSKAMRRASSPDAQATTRTWGSAASIASFRAESALGRSSTAINVMRFSSWAV